MIRALRLGLCFGVLSLHLAYCFQPMRWCGGPLNPLETAKAARMATEVLWSCKDEIMALNIRPSVIKEARKACAGYHLCFAFVQDTNDDSTSFRDKVLDCMEKYGNAWSTAFPDMPEKLNLDVKKTVDAVRRCLKSLKSTDLPYILKTVEYLRDFVSG
ncbi:uncharacterized protein LOC144145159 [Haemaphysalis longicornis]